VRGPALHAFVVDPRGHTDLHRTDLTPLYGPTLFPGTTFGIHYLVLGPCDLHYLKNYPLARHCCATYGNSHSQVILTQLDPTCACSDPVNDITVPRLAIVGPDIGPVVEPELGPTLTCLIAHSHPLTRTQLFPGFGYLYSQF